ncbi:SpaA isopeptide-forming pilin-related protein [Corynebacterium hindlerae]|uniref:SpaA isopeptide-forming pilin-related protein n=1 Tax=Corynebacterium hindlerae TaxID=699041 RepID=UPI003AAD1AC0
MGPAVGWWNNQGGAFLRGTQRKLVALITALTVLAAVVFGVVPNSNADEQARIGDEVQVAEGSKGYEIKYLNSKGATVTRTPMLFELKSDSFNGRSYCIESDVPIDVSTGIDGKFVSWGEFAGENNFKSNAQKVNWIVENSYPAVNLDNLAKAVGMGRDQLNEKSAIAQTQAAIWHFTDGIDYQGLNSLSGAFGDRRDALVKGEKQLYDYLVSAKNTGVKRIESIEQVNKDKVTEKDGVVGPFEFETIPAGAEFSVKLGEGQSLVNKESNKFYVKVDPHVTSVKFDLEVPNVGVGGAIVYAEKDGERQQTTIVTYSEQKAPLTRTVEWKKDIESVAKHDIEISKVDLNGTELPGAEIKVVNKDGSEVDSWVSTDKPHRISVAPGEYVFKETAAPKGYKVVSDITFTVSAEGKVSTSDVQQTVNNSVRIAQGEGHKLTVINEAEPAPLTKVLLSKVALGQKDELAGAEMTLSKVGIAWDEPVTALIEEWTSGNTPHEFSAEPGVYQLTEVTAPQGYEVAESIIFYVSANGTVQFGVKGEDGIYKLVDAKDNKVVMVDKPSSPTTTPSATVTTSEPTPSETTVTVTSEVPVTVTSTTEVPTTVTTTVETPVPTTVTETTVVPTTVVTTETTTTEVVVPTTVETTTTEMAAPTTTTTTVQASSGFDLRYVLGALGLWALLKEGGSSSSDMGSSSSSTKAPIVVPAPSVPNRQDRVDSISNEPPVAQKGVQPQQTPAKKMLASTGANVVGLSAVAALLLALGLYFVAKRRKES